MSDSEFIPPYELMSLLLDHMADSAVLVRSLNKIAPANRVESDKRLKNAVYYLKYYAAEILTTLREVYPNVHDGNIQS